MEAHFRGVSLGAVVSGSVGGPTWAHDLEVSIGDTGITVAGAAGTQASTLPWSAVRQFAPGFTLAFPDGRPATELEVALADRSLRLLVPADQLPPTVVAQLMNLAPAPSPQTGPPAANPSPTQGVSPVKGTAPAPAPGTPLDGAASGLPGLSIAGTAGGVAGSYGPEMITSRPPAKAAGRKRKPVLVGGLATIAIVAAVAVVAVMALGGATSKSSGATSTTAARSRRTTTPTTSPVPTHELSGPPASMTPNAATAAVLIKNSDLRGWKSNDDAGPEDAGQPQAFAQAVNDPFLPSASSVVEPAYAILQQCSNLPLDHMQLFTGNYYSGGPPTWNSSSYNPSNSNPTQLSVTPQIFSIASEVATPSVEQSDFASIAGTSFPSCFGSFMTSYLRGIYGQMGGTVDSLKSTGTPISQVPGVETVDVVVKAQLVVSGDVFNFRNTFVLMGAGRLEELLEGYDSTNEPIPSGTWSALVSTLQHRMEATASQTRKLPPKTTKK